MPNETPKNGCKYYCEKTEWQCPREPLPDSEDGYCICHERRDDKDEKFFREEIDKILNDEKADAYHFEGFYFPFDIAFVGWNVRWDMPESREFKKNTYFTDAIFKGAVSFRGAQFLGKETVFSGARFMGEETEFRAARFTGAFTFFASARFIGKRTSFLEAEFSAVLTYFTETQFSGESTSFYGAKFIGAGKFARAQFSAEETDFTYVTVSGLLDFSNATFRSEQTRLYDMRAEEKGKLVFRHTTFEQTNKNNLGRIDLSRCFFQETNIEHCDLSLALLDWKTKLLNETSGTSDYASFLATPDWPHRFSHAAESYRMLKVNFNKRQDYGRAAICHYREEVRKRKALKWWTPVGSLAYLYSLVLQLSCGYGEKLQNVLGFTVFLFLLFSLIFSFTPLIPAGDDPSTLQEIDNSLRGRNAPAIPLWNKLQGGLKYTFFHLLPLWRFSDLRAATDVGNIMSGVMTIAGAFMIGLFIYVFRRRLMR